MASAMSLRGFSRPLKFRLSGCRFSFAKTVTPGEHETMVSRGQSTNTFREGGGIENARRSGTVAWNATPGDLDYPEWIRRTGDPRWASLMGIGNREILSRSVMGLICSKQCPGSIVIKTFDAIREIRDAGIVVAGGFHSPMERECLDFLLRGEQPVIACLARSLTRFRLPRSWRPAFDAGRLLILSTFAASVPRATKDHAQTRNEFVATLAACILIPHASPGGKAEALVSTIRNGGKLFFALEDSDNQPLFTLGARHYKLDDIRRVLLDHGHNTRRVSNCHQLCSHPDLGVSNDRQT